MKLNPGFRRLVLLTPPDVRIPFSLNNRGCDVRRHESLLASAQRLRGRIYLEDGALSSEALRDGRHVVASDYESWHLLVLDDADEVCGCVRFREHDRNVTFPDLIAAESAIASCSRWGERMRRAVEDEMAIARSLDFPFLEIGGWALSREIRGSVEALRMILAIYGFSRELGGAVGLATATVRHSSSSILRRLGGRSLEFQNETLPAYSDHNYGCEMELLRFYSWAPNPRYDSWVDAMSAEMRAIPVLAPTFAALPWARVCTQRANASLVHAGE